MVFTQLVYLDTHENSMRGNYRGFIAFIAFMVLLLPTVKKMYSWVGLPIVSVLLASAVAVQVYNPTQQCSDALLYGFLVGLVVFGVLVVFKPDTILASIYSMFVTGLVSFGLCQLVSRYPEIFAPT
jgi:hypothetical protein